MNETNLAEYWQERFYKEQINTWSSVCLNANTGEMNHTKRLSQELKDKKRHTNEIEKDLHINEKAL